MQQAASLRFHPFEVIAKKRESETITSFIMAPRNKDHWRSFEAGQFLTIRIPDGAGGHVLRNYTVSSSPKEIGIYRITVKREAAPSDQVPQGFSSCWLHDEVEPGTVLDIDTPRGAFKLDPESTRPVVLLSGGVGLTPTVSMLHILAHETERPVWFIHACDSMAVHALRNEVQELAAVRSGITVHFCHRFADEEDVQAGLCHSTGFLTREAMQKLLPLDDYEIYMCGPPPFMKALYGILTGLGVRKERIAYEFFGPSSLLSEPEPQAEKPAALNAGDGTEATATVSNDSVRIVLQKSGRELAWTESSISLLDCLEANGIEPEFSCRAGICGTCEQGLISGDIEYFEEPLEDVPQGRVLLCCTKPKSSVVLDL
jgi:ferredoxin-NADP reductase